MLGGADGDDHILVTAVLGLFAFEHDNILPIGCASHLVLMGQQLLELTGVNRHFF